MRYELFLAFRYLGGLRHSQPFISVIAGISVLGVAIGVAALLVVLGVMTGFDNDIQSKIIGNNPHLTIRAEGGLTDVAALQRKLEKLPGVAASAPFIDGKALLQNRDFADGVMLRGIDPQQEARVTRLVGLLQEGIWPEAGNQMVLGSELASSLSAYTGTEIEMLTGSKRRPVTMTVVGEFTTGYYEYDRHLALAPISTIQEILDSTDRVSGLGVRLEDPLQAPSMKERLRQALGYPYWILSWMDLNPNLFAALKLEKVTMFIVLTLIVLVACFNIIATLLMMVVGKIKEVGILKSLGATSGSIRNIFTCVGLSIGLGGTALGTALGVGLCWALQRYEFVQLPASVYYIDTLPVKLEAADLMTVVAAAIGISWLACLYPAWIAARFTPAEAIRYE